MVLIVVQRTGIVTLLLPLFNEAIACTPVSVNIVALTAFTEFKSALACNPETVVIGLKSRYPDIGAPEKLSKANM